MRITQTYDTELAAEIREKLKQNNYYCPCMLQKNEDTKCMCKDFRDKINRHELGQCHCGLYIIVEE